MHLCRKSLTNEVELKLSKSATLERELADARNRSISLQNQLEQLQQSQVITTY